MIEDGTNSVKLFFDHGNNYTEGNIEYVTKDLQGSVMDFPSELFHDFEEVMQCGSWSLDLSSFQMKFTDGLYELLGFSKAELPSPVAFEFYLDKILHGHREVVSELVDASAKTGEGFEHEYPVKTRAGLERIFVTRAKVVNGQLVGITKDITNIRNFEREKERSIHELNRSNQDLEEFAYVASHDLQEPLRKISMFSERLKLRLNGSVDKESELFFNRIEASSVNMRNLIDNLLEFSRANRSTGNFVRLDIGKVFRSALSDLELQIEETKSEISVKGKFPEIDVVESELKQLFTNLVSNAVKFRKAGQPAHIELQIEKLTQPQKRQFNLSSAGNYYKFSFVDNGIGFEEQYAERIFQVFQRLHGKADYPGSGIGLAICKKIVNNHNGVIFATSVPEHGATFTVILPEKQP